MLHDAHNHLQDAALAPHLARIASAWPGLAGARGEMVVNGTHPDDWPRVTALAAAHPFVRPAYGIHPWHAGSPRPDDWLARLTALLDAHPRASVGETGLDRWILDSARPDDPRLAGLRRAPMAEQRNRARFLSPSWKSPPRAICRSRSTAFRPSMNSSRSCAPGRAPPGVSCSTPTAARPRSCRNS
jgi:hypothetical protein